MMPEHNVYSDLISQIEKLVETGRKEAVTAVNQVMVATYWGIGRHIVNVFYMNPILETVSLKLDWG